MIYLKLFRRVNLKFMSCQWLDAIKVLHSYAEEWGMLVLGILFNTKVEGVAACKIHESMLGWDDIYMCKLHDLVIENPCQQLNDTCCKDISAIRCIVLHQP